jgi:hypothetical protein
MDKMHQQENRAIYNSLRMHWLADQSLRVENWQVEDYRILPIEALFSRLQTFNIQLDRTSFNAFADEIDSPEELTDALINNPDESPTIRDQIYLLVFELWRRLVPQKPSLTIFCDELDHQILLYEASLENTESIQDALANLQNILDDSVDTGMDPIDAFETISIQCANDLESFLYAFIADRFDEENDSFAEDLIEAFSQYMKDSKWFDLLQARLQYNPDYQIDLPILKSLISQATKAKDPIFNMELLGLLAATEKPELFLSMINQTLPLIKREEEFQDLLELGVDFCDYMNFEKGEGEVNALLESREQKDPEDPLDPKDPAIAKFKQMLKESLHKS